MSLPSRLSIAGVLRSTTLAAPGAWPCTAEVCRVASDTCGHLFIANFSAPAVFGPVATKWFGFLQRHVVLKSTATTTIARVACDQFLFAPVQLTCFLSSMAIMEGSSPVEKWKSSFGPAYKANLFVWPFVQGANFAFVPLELRVLVVNVVSLGEFCAIC